MFHVATYCIEVRPRSGYCYALEMRRRGCITFNTATRRTGSRPRSQRETTDLHKEGAKAQSATVRIGEVPNTELSRKFTLAPVRSAEIREECASTRFPDAHSHSREA